YLASHDPPARSSVMKWMPALLLSTSLLVPAAVTAPPEQPRAAGPHWSFRKPSQPQVPRFSDAADRAWARTRIDAFILQRLRQEGLRPAPEADRLTLIRRLRFDLTGLPPTPAEVTAFVQDSAPDAYEKLVDRLLASPQ